MLAPVPGQAHAGVTLLLHGSGQLFQFAPVEQQLAGAHRVGDDVGAGGRQGRDVAAEQPGFAILEQYVTVNQLQLACPQTFYFPAGQDQTSLELVLDEVIVSRLFILRDGPCWVFLLFSHRGGIIGSCTRVGYGVATCLSRLIESRTMRPLF
ncbi:hypothetical protein D3C73_874610 [compost metagenome]